MDSKTFKLYYQLAKPGIVYGNLIAVIAGFLFASKGIINPAILIAILLGSSFVIGSGCVFNNFLDRDIDKKMERTKKRATVTGLISSNHVLIYGALLGFLGFFTLFKFTNLLTLLVGAVGFLVYVFLYEFSKRKGSYGTLVGSIAGATPPLAGYTAVTNHLDTPGILLFLVLVFWQMPHFYSIAIFRLKDYVSAGIPVLPAQRGLLFTKISIILFTALFVISTLAVWKLGYVGNLYLAVLGLVGIIWLTLGISGFFIPDTTHWARRMFFFSLISLLSFCFMISV